MALEGRRVLFISYNGMLEPLGQSQVLPYLRQLSKRGARISLLSFEKAAAFTDQGNRQRQELHDSLAAEGIRWDSLRYHQRPSLPATMFDVLNGVRLARRIIREERIELVHARSHIPAVIALALKRQFPVKLIFDIRGLLAEEYVDANHWQQGGVPYRLTKAMERRALAAADGIVTLTESIWPIIREWDGLRGREVIHEVVPCCGNLELFKFKPEDRERRRSELGLQDRRVLVYSGSIGGWYATEQMADLFVRFLKRRADWHFLWLTQGPSQLIKELMVQRQVDKDHYSIKSVDSSVVASYLCAADVGVAFYKPALSRLATSPVKLAEYLACGLPVIVNAGVGDSDALVTRERVGVVVGDFNEPEYEDAATTLEGFVIDAAETRRHSRAVAERLFNVRTVGVEGYARLYERVFSG